MELNKKDLVKIIISAILIIIAGIIKNTTISLGLYIIRIYNCRNRCCKRSNRKYHTWRII